MALAACRDNNIIHRMFVNQKRLADQRAMATPGHRFRTHDRYRGLFIQSHEFLERRSESIRLHMMDPQKVPTQEVAEDLIDLVRAYLK